MTTGTKGADFTSLEPHGLSTLILSSSRDCIVVLDLDGHTQFVSPGGVEAMEIDDVNAIIGLSWLRVWTGTTLDAAREAVAKAKSGEVGRFEGFCPTHKGTPKWWDVLITPLFGTDGKPTQLVSVSRDISERVDAETRLLLSEETLRLATDAAEVGTWDLDLMTDVLTWPRQTKAMFGISPDVPVSMTDFYNGLHPDDLPHVSAAFAAALDPAIRSTYDVEYRTIGQEDGVLRWIAAKGKGIFDQSGICVRAVGTAIDITKRRASQERLLQSERQLAESEAKFRAITDSIDQMIWSARPDGYHDYFNQRWYDFTGVPSGSTDGVAWNGMFHPDDRDRARARWEQSLETGDLYEIEYRLRHRSGAYRWVLGRGVCFRDAKGQIDRWFGTCTDIQELVEARQVLTQSRADLERQVTKLSRERGRTWEVSPDLLGICNVTGYFESINPAWQATLGWSPEEMRRTPIFDLIHPDDAEKTQDAFKSLVENKPVLRFENRYRHKQGGYRWLSWVSVPPRTANFIVARVMSQPKNDRPKCLPR